MRIDKNAVNAVNLPAPVILYATPTQQHHAQLVARERKRGHDHLRRPEEDRGGHNLMLDYFGSLAEIVVCDWLERNGLTPAPDYLTRKPPTAPDIVLGKRRLDIKSSPIGKDFLTLNEAQYQRKSGECDGYLPVLFLDEVTLQIMKPIPYDKIAYWRLITPERNPKCKTPFRSIRRQELLPLTTIEELSIFPLE